MNFSQAFAYDVDDTAELRAEKFAILLVSLSCCIAGCVWSVMYFWVFGPSLVAFLPIVFVAVVGSALVVSHLVKRHLIAAYSQVVCIIYVTAAIQWSIGGLFDSGFVIAWGFCGPIIALMVFSRIESAAWLALYLANIAITFVADDRLAVNALPVSAEMKAIFLVMNIGFSSVVVFIFASYFVQSTRIEREKSNQLLLNILPEKTARTLKSREGIIAEKHEDVSILFADIVEFTGYASGRRPEEIVSTLNSIFTHFDRLVEQRRLEKIKTIGDAYMVVGGLSGREPDHAERIAGLALDMMSAIGTFERESGAAFSLRIGIHAGPVVAGVIGKSKFAYDLWGDTVNVASRMESTGVDRRIQVSEVIQGMLGDRFAFEKRGRVEVKGMGLMDTYFLIGRL